MTSARAFPLELYARRVHTRLICDLRIVRGGVRFYNSFCWEGSGHNFLWASLEKQTKQLSPKQI